MKNTDEYKDKYILAQLFRTLNAKDDSERTAIYNETMTQLKEEK